MALSPRNRRAIALLAMLISLVIYCVMAAWIATAILPRHWLAELVFYVIAGIAWVFPARWILRQGGASS